MSFPEAFILALPSVTIALIGLIVQARRERNKPQVDEGSAYAALTTALQTSGKTIDDLFKMLSDVPELKRKIEDLENEMEDLRSGVEILTNQLVEHRIEPRWKPRNRIEPIKKASEFGRK